MDDNANGREVGNDDDNYSLSSFEELSEWRNFSEGGGCGADECIYNIGNGWSWRPEQVLRRIETNDPSLVRLNISGAYSFNVGGDAGQQIRLGAAIGNNTKLKTLIFSASGSSRFLCSQKEKSEELFRGVALNRSVQELCFQNFRCADGDIFFFMNPFFENNQNLRRLRLHRCDLSRKGKRLFALALAKSSSLRHFEYTGAPGNQGFDEDEAMRLVLAAAEHPRMRTLVLRNCPVMAGEENEAPASLVSLLRGRLVSLDLTETGMGDGAATVLADGLAESSALSSLVLACNPGISNWGWRRIFEVLEGGSPAIAYLNLGGNVPLLGWREADGYTFAGDLASSLRDNGALKALDLSFNEGIPGLGWVALSAILLRSASSALEMILIDGRAGRNTIDSGVLISFASSLAVNEKLEELHIRYGREQDEGWEAVSRSLCNSSTVMDTFLSNHTLERVLVDDREDHLPADLRTSLRWNRELGKFDAARLKIIKCHFTGNYGMCHFIDMDVGVFPHVIAWMGKEGEENIVHGVEVGGVPLLYRFVRNMQHLLDFPRSNSSKNSLRRSTRKRSRPSQQAE